MRRITSTGVEGRPRVVVKGVRRRKSAFEPLKEDIVVQQPVELG
jgi:hypothetical protein